MTMQRNLRKVLALQHATGSYRMYETYWNEGANDAIETIGNPEARTANDWNKPATTRVQGGSDSVTSNPMSSTMKHTSSKALVK